ncbi:MAG: helix-turn-helix domain-containing protein [Thermoguttaceae bacterium]
MSEARLLSLTEFLVKGVLKSWTGPRQSWPRRSSPPTSLIWAKRYPATRIQEIRRLATEHTDTEIADLLNNRGQRSSRDKRFTAKMIGWIRYKHRIAAVELKRPDELTVAEVAAKLSVSHGVVYYWVERGILPARR